WGAMLAFIAPGGEYVAGSASPQRDGGERHASELAKDPQKETHQSDDRYQGHQDRNPQESRSGWIQAATGFTTDKREYPEGGIPAAQAGAPRFGKMSRVAFTKPEGEKGAQQAPADQPDRRDKQHHAKSHGFP